MPQYNYSQLLGRMKTCGYTQAGLSKAIGISECSLNLKLNNKADFRQREILLICNILSIPAEEIDKYFFVHKL